ncbi:hypothetical protein BDQ17DRAFT_1436107 [Cyathus striatus]|nr:hypothetical protein BDQ17DRAFT_1436107 [Cyathus striatus]
MSEGVGLKLELFDLQMQKLSPSSSMKLSYVDSPVSLTSLWTVAGGNTVSERQHQSLQNAVYKCAGDKKRNWPKYVDPSLLAIRSTPTRSTGYPPYYLLYGIDPKFSFDYDDATWTTLPWHEVTDTESLIAMRARQIARQDEVAEQAHQHQRRSRQHTIDDMMRTKGKHFDFHKFEVGMRVLRHETYLDNQFGQKDKWRWTGPYIIHEVREHDSFVLRELDGTVIRGHVNAHRPKPTRTTRSPIRM